MTETFQSPAIELHPAPEATEQAADQREHHTAVIGEQIPAKVRAWLDAQPWHAEPLDSIPDLVDYARNAEWTTSNTARTRRLIWLYAIAAPARIAPWTILRVWKGADAPGFAGELPSIRDASDVDGAKDRTFAAAYSTASVGARVAESAPRTGIALLMGWCGANAVGWPEHITVAYWWQKVTELWAHLTASANHATSSAAPEANHVASDVAGFIIIVAAVAIWLLMKRRNKANEK